MEATGSESAQQAASATPSTGTPAPWAWLAVLASATLLALSLWISADAVVPTLARLWHISGATAMWLTASVQLSFVTGALVSATLGLPDRLNSRRLMVGCCVAGALCNGLFVLLGRNIALGLTLRWLTGVAIAGAYPTTLKMVTPPPRAMAACAEAAANAATANLSTVARGSGAQTGPTRHSSCWWTTAAATSCPPCWPPLWP